MSDKRRPDNGPGANGLRGGVHTYNMKVQSGNWVEAYGGPGDYKRGFSTVDFETEGQHMQKGAGFRLPEQFGAELPLPQLLNRKPPKASDSFVTDEDIDRRSTMQQTNDTMLRTKANYKEYTPPPTLTREQLEDYRRKWTIDTDDARQVRYEQVESRLAGKSSIGAADFAPRNVRFLPGTPLSLEKYREKMVETFGVLALSAFRRLVGMSMMPIRDFKVSLSEIGVKLSPFEVDQIIAFTTPSDSQIRGADVLRSLKGSTPGFDSKVAKKIFNEAADGADTVEISILLENLQSTMKDFPEVIHGIGDFIEAYSSDGGNSLTHSEFIELHSDMYSSNPRSYAKLF